MKICLLLLAALVFSAVASDDLYLSSGVRSHGVMPQGTDAEAYAQTWLLANATHGMSIYSAGDRWVCDDFVLSGDWELDQVVIWVIWTGETGTALNVIFSEDDGSGDPNNATDVWSEMISCTNEFQDEWESSGGDFYDVYKVTATIPADAYPNLSHGANYWIEVQADVVDNCYVMVSDNFVGSSCWFNDGSGVFVVSEDSFGYSSDMFFELHGNSLALESDTWGAIKSLF